MITTVRTDEPYKLPQEAREKLSAFLKEHFAAKPVTQLPKTIVRIDDGEEFVLNENGTYSNRCMLPFKAKGHLINEYSYDILMVNNKGFFRVPEDCEDTGKGRE